MFTILSVGLFLLSLLVIALVVLRKHADLSKDRGLREGLRLSGLWSWKGTIAAGPYVFWILFDLLIYINLSRYLIYYVFGRQWTLFDLWYRQGPWGLEHLINERTFAAVFITLSLACLWIAAILTLRRLRTVGLPAWLVVMTVAPGINLLFFFVLTSLATQATGPGPERPGIHTLLDRLIPDTESGSAVAGILITILIGLPLIVIGTNLLGSYGWALFVLLPFFLGFLSVLLYAYRGTKRLGRCIGVSVLSVLLLGMALIAVAVEGLVCLLMALPIALPLAILGGSFAYLIQRRPSAAVETPQVMALLPLVLAAMMGIEKALPPAPRLNEVSTEIVVNASPDRVWPHVVSLGELPEPDDWLLRSGIAYPVRTEALGHRGSAVRHCVFSTGTIIEPVRVWEPARKLEFEVVDQPPLMRELSPYEIHPPHLEMQFLRCRAGRFVLTRLSSGRTVLQGTSWYESRLWPGSYWRLWSDWIAHRIHMRVLSRIRKLAEESP